MHVYIYMKQYIVCTIICIYEWRVCIVLFFLPWEGGTLSGTTDHVAEISMTPEPTEEEIDFIIQESNRYLNRKIERKDVKAAW